MNKLDKALELLGVAKAITAKIEADSRAPSDVEKEELKKLLAEISVLRVEGKVDELQAGVASPTTGTGLYAKFQAAGWERGKRATIEFKASEFVGDLDDLQPTRREGAPLGYDRRFAFPAFRQESVSDGETSVQILRQSARALAAAADVERALDDTSAKPMTNTSSKELVSESLLQFATVSDPIPAILAANGFASILNQDLALAHAEAIDAHVLVAIAASTPSDSGLGDGDLIAATRHGIADMEADGYSPSVLLLHPDDYADLDLFRDGGVSTESYSFATSARSPGQAPLWGLSIRVSKAVGAPLLIDPSAAGRLFMSPIALDSDDRGDNFNNNTVTYRLENHGLFLVERGDAIREIVPTIGS